MAEAVQSIEGVILPHDLLPDDTTVIYKNRIPIDEKDFDGELDEIAEDSRDSFRYIDLALAYYNGIHNTDYKAEGYPQVQKCYGDSVSIHCGFFAVPTSTAVGCEPVTEYFCSELSQQYGSEEVVTSCRILDVLTTDCKVCPRGDISEMDKELSSIWLRHAPPPVSEYSHDLAAGVTLSDKAKLRLCFALTALTHYNKKQKASYKLVDVLPFCISKTCNVIHCNFIAKQNGVDASDKLFFAELASRKGDDWIVVVCRVVSGKTRAGCHGCGPHGGKRVVHPLRGFRFGLQPQVRLDPPQLRSRG